MLISLKRPLQIARAKTGQNSIASVLCRMVMYEVIRGPHLASRDNVWSLSWFIYNRTKSYDFDLIRRWDSKREHFYDDIAHVLQNTKKEPTSFNKVDNS